jgi:hypothetical protein
MTIDCQTFEQLADELALGLLTGIERADALEHLDECHTCRAEVASLTQIADEILLLAPSIAPDEGFASRVVARIAGPAAECRSHPWRNRAHRRVLALAAAVVLAIVLVAGGALVAAGVVGHHGSQRGPATQVADMRTPGGTVVGTASLHEGAATTVDMRLPGWQALLRSYAASSGARYWLELDAGHGARTRVALDSAGNGSWHVTSDAAHDVTAVAVVDEHGVVWCRAQFT